MCGGSDMPTAPTTYQYGSQKGADQGAFGAMQNISGGQNYAGDLWSQYGGGLAQGLGTGPNANVTGNTLQGMGMGAFGQGQQLMNMGLDPQHALYNQEYQQNVDQTRAAEAARGIAMTPYGAGVENQSNQQFNNLWQNQQAQRAAAMSQAAQGMYGQGAAMLSAGQMLPAQYNAAQIGNLSGLQGAGNMSYALQQQSAQNYLNYLSGGNAANQTAVNNYQAQVQAQQAQAQQDQAMWQGIGSMAGAMMMFSDARMKENIRRIGQTTRGHNVYEFNYIGDDRQRQGVLAHEVMLTQPEAVHDVGGYLAVDYSQIGDF